MPFEKRLALSLPLDGPMSSLGAVGREMEGLGYRDAWTLETDGSDAFTPLGVVAATTGMRLGTATVNVFTRGPATLAQSAASVADIAPGRFVLGIGSGSAPIVETWNGLTFARPALRVREMATFLRQALAGERVVFEGKTFSVNGYRLSRVPSRPVPIHIAALREGMLRVAGEVGDGVTLNWLAATDVPKSVGVVRAAATAAGRDPHAIEVVARLMVNVDPPGEEADTFCRRHITSYLTVGVYQQFHRWLGRTSLEGMWEAWGAGDRRGALAAIPEATVNELIIRGDASERRAHVQQYLDAGVDTASLWMLSGHPDAKVREERVLQALREHAPKAMA
ncbi:MAG: LLM class F420-dependent oxidoreductase [Dehalococcoidia bacterium]|nr:LLM class F420-dependent oxidoreductase [Dehalococcoidia bacterium]MCB9485799.1 LLM class F420-dependent oxidoreductase [Thermoflexaceae bacterium]